MVGGAGTVAAFLRATGIPFMTSDPRKALLLALAGFMLLSVGDVVVKTIAGEWPGSAVAALRYAFGSVGLVALVAWRLGRVGFRVPKPGLQVARGAAVGECVHGGAGNGVRPGPRCGRPGRTAGLWSWKG